MTVEERLEKHEKMALSYYNSYKEHSVKDGKTYDENWVFAKDATYSSPYFGGATVNLSECPINVRKSSTMEAKTYSITLADWGPLDFKCWPSLNGFAMKTHFGGHDENGVLYDFYAYGFVETNENAEIVHWETHVSPEYNAFLDKVIGGHGPFIEYPDEYITAVGKTLKNAGINIEELL